jgi:hypothetical protein
LIPNDSDTSGRKNPVGAATRKRAASRIEATRLVVTQTKSSLMNPRPTAGPYVQANAAPSAIEMEARPGVNVARCIDNRCCTGPAV